MSRFERIAELMGGDVRNEAGELEARYNVAPGTFQPVVRAGEGTAILSRLKWGLVPYWAKESNAGIRPVNAKSDTAHEKPMFRRLIRERRCLVPCDWFYEWREHPPDKVPFVIRMALDEPFFMGGLWDTWHPGREEELSTFTVLTTAPNALMQTLHHRMPVIIPHVHAERWLDPAVRDIADLLAPYPAEQMSAYAVSKLVNAVRNDGPQLIQPLD